MRRATFLIGRDLAEKGEAIIPFFVYGEKKVISFKANEEIDRLLDIEARKRGLSKSKLIRLIVCTWLLESGAIRLEELGEVCYPEQPQEVLSF